MANSVRETALEALADALAAAAPDADVKRGEIPDEIPDAGLVRIFDGDPGEPDQVIGVPSYTFEHEVEVAVVVSGDALEDRLDQLLRAIGMALAADRTLGGAVEYLDFTAGAIGGLALDGAPEIKGAKVSVTLIYTTGNPLL